MQPGQKLLHYELTEKLGEGGMGVVWKATDSLLGREVAIKILPQNFAADDDRLARFDREARLLASLNHPNIAGIYGIHQAPSTSSGQASVHFLAMELVPGEDLAQRLQRGPLPVDQALRVAREIATGLEAAHESGVIHRDLKPANVKLTQDGKAKVLDFGLAKAADAAATASGTSASLSPTMTSAGTMVGMILGTASYMSPEQAAGQAIDRRCDIWSFGVLLHELLTGKRMFDGETVSHTLAGVLRAEIDLSELPKDVPPRVRKLLERCLERDSTRRLRDIGEARIALDDAIERPEKEGEQTTGGSRTPRARLWPWIAASLFSTPALIATFVLLLVSLSRSPPPEPVRRFTLAMPEHHGLRQGDGASITISPDGANVVTRGGAGTDDILYLRALDEFESRPIQGSIGANAPQYSVDGEWISFINSQGLYKIRPSGGAPIRIAEIPASAIVSGYHWADDGYFYYSSGGHLWRVSENRPEPEQLTKEDSLENRLLTEPYALPGRGGVLCSTRGAPRQPSQLMVLDLQSKELIDLGQPGSDPTYLPTGHILFREGNAAAVVAFDINTLETRGSPVPVLPRAAMDLVNLQIGVSATGTVVYIPKRDDDLPSLVYVDHEGSVEPVITSGTPLRAVSDPRLSPDGRRLVVSLGSEEIWMVDLLTQTPTLLSENGFYPVWSPDSSEVVYGSTRGESFDVYRVPVDLSRPESILLDAKNNMRTMDWTRQGVLVLREEIPDKGMDLLSWSDLGDESTRATLLDGPDDELAPDVSPDGKWVAYVSDYSGSDEIYVTSFPAAGARTRVSQSGGHSPVWAPDGKTLYYLDQQKMMALSIETDPAIRILDRKELFEGKFVQYRWSRQYDITPDGTRFVMIQNPPGGDIEVVTNWFEELRALDD